MTNNHYTTTNSYSGSYDNTHSINDKDRDESIDSFKTDERSLKGKEFFVLIIKINKSIFRTFY